VTGVLGTALESEWGSDLASTTWIIRRCAGDKERERRTI
jgi:hypothetical protein